MLDVIRISALNGILVTILPARFSLVIYNSVLDDTDLVKLWRLPHVESA